MRIISHTVFLFLFIINGLFAQAQKDVVKIKSRYGFEVERRPSVNFNVFVNYHPETWQPRVIVAVNIQNDDLQFTKQGQQYLAEYQISTALRRDKQAVYKQTWTERVLLDNFELTNAKDVFQYHLYKLDHFEADSMNILEPGDYECLLEVRDLTSRKNYQSTRTLNISDQREADIAHSGIAFLIPSAEDELALAATGKAFEFARPFDAFVRIRSVAPDSVTVNARIFRTVREGDRLYYQRFFRVGSGKTVTDVRFPMPADSLREGTYRLRLSIPMKTNTIDVESEFSIHWFDKPTYLYKYDLAIRPMQYILTRDEYKQATSLSYNELERWFNNYWKQRDPSPGRQYNELLAVFFERVQKANAQFSLRYKEGWETDRGKILILYGEPDRIENKRFATDQKPHIIWYYESNNSQFIFVDEKKDGDFTLLTADMKVE